MRERREKKASRAGPKLDPNGRCDTPRQPGCDPSTFARSNDARLILDSTGTPVTAINAASFGSAANWFYYLSDGQASSTVNFWARPYYSPATLKTVFQSFDVTTSPTTDIVTPFAIPSWGGLTTGVWILVVYNDLGIGNYCGFIVV